MLSLIEISAIIFSIATAVVIMFQACLALGAPWGTYAMAGKFPGKVPPRMRIAAIAQALVLVGMQLIVLFATDIMFQQWSTLCKKLIWGVVAFSLLGIVANSITPSAKERRIWLPVTIVLFVSSFLVASMN